MLLSGLPGVTSAGQTPVKSFMSSFFRDIATYSTDLKN